MAAVLAPSPTVPTTTTTRRHPAVPVLVRQPSECNVKASMGLGNRLLRMMSLSKLPTGDELLREDSSTNPINEPPPPQPLVMRSVPLISSPKKRTSDPGGIMTAMQASLLGQPMSPSAAGLLLGGKDCYSVTGRRSECFQPLRYKPPTPEHDITTYPEWHEAERLALENEQSHRHALRLTKRKPDA
jgi:hypothetical protein